MIEINYLKNPHCFELIFKLREYIPVNYFNSEIDLTAERRFYIDLLKKHNILTDAGTPEIWNVHYSCVYNKISFSMILDEDYGFIHFIVENPQSRVAIAEMLKHLIENMNRE